MKKRFAIALVIAILLPILASCSRVPEIYNGGCVRTSFDPEYASADYGGEPFTYLVITHTDQIKDYYGGDYIDAEKLTGDKISDAVYNRNLQVQEKYNVIVEQLEEIGKDPHEVLSAYIMSGDFCYDAIYGWGYKMGACITENYFADVSLLPHVDLTREYWSPSAIDDLSIDGRLYIFINDVSMNKLEWASFLFYNKQVYEDFQIEESFGNIYDHVRNGTWTLDLYLNMVKSVSRDLNGDFAITRDDVFGLLAGDALGVGILRSCGISYTETLEDGSYGLSLYSEKTLSIIDRVYNVYSNNKYVLDWADMWDGADTTGYGDQWEYARSVFTFNHSLFSTGCANFTSEAAYRNMESDYGIVPNPKFDEKQENYITPVDRLASIFAVPATYRTDGVTTAGPDRTGMILEYMAFKSNEVLLPVYYNQVLKGQRLDGDDAEMLDIVCSTTKYEISEMISYEPTIVETVDNMLKRPSTATSVYKSYRSKLEKELNEFYTKVLLLEVNGG